MMLVDRGVVRLPRHRVSALILLAASAGLLSPACATSRAAAPAQEARPAAQGAQPPPGVFHRIEPGQTLYTISKTYGVAVETVTSANDLANADRIQAGETLFIPGAQSVLDDMTHDCTLILFEKRTRLIQNRQHRNR